MKRFIQSCLLAAYKWVARTGILSAGWTRSLFLAAYDVYKQFVEAGDVEALRQFVRPGESVVDIGANVGFFTKRFARWVSEGGLVIAVEPETSNLLQLRRTIDRSGASAVVRVFEGVAAEQAGTLNLAINPVHPGDHKIAAEGIEVAAFTVDELVRQAGAGRVCLVKIDVQGAEERVIRGALETLGRDRPALFVEVDDDALRRMGSSAARLVSLITGLGYVIRKTGSVEPAESPAVDEVLKACRDGRYADLTFVAAPDVSRPARS